MSTRQFRALGPVGSRKIVGRLATRCGKPCVTSARIATAPRAGSSATIALLLATATMYVGCASGGGSRGPERSPRRPVVVVPEGAPAAPEPGQPAEAAQLARFVVKAREGASDELATDLASRFGPSARAVPLFPEVDEAADPDGMARMFEVHVPASALPSEHPFENAYWLKGELELEEAEPDLEATLDESLEMSTVCLADGPPPPDRTWSLFAIHAQEAWGLEPDAGGRRFGEGVTVCHPDTGWAEHVDLDSGRLDLARARNFLSGGTADGRDPLEDDEFPFNPGHGVGTGSVIVSGHQSGEILGVAPGATLVPIRTARSVVQLLDSDLARAVNYAVDAGCDVISMSLGGRGFFGLKAAIRRAVQQQLIVAAAAGNCVRFVVNPAAYPDTLAVAGTNIEEKPWRGSSRGAAVDIAAPAEHVWVAHRKRAADPTTGSAAGQGTSYAVANVAGAAALWLAFHGRDELLERYQGNATLQEVFRRLVRETAHVPPGWNAGSFGAGILDVSSLLAAEPPPPAVFEEIVTEEAESELAELAAVVGRSPRELGPLLAELFGVPLVEVEGRLEEFRPELVHLALTDPAGFERLLASLSNPDAGELESGEVTVLSRGSERLRSQVTR